MNDAFFSPTYSPVLVQTSSGLDTLKFGGSSAEDPVIREITIVRPTFGTVLVPISITDPTLVKIQSVELPADPSARLHIETGWRRIGTELTVPFFGPYAYLTKPGEYELVVIPTSNADPESIQVSLRIYSGVNEPQASILLDPNRCHGTVTGALTVGAFATVNLVPYSGFSRYKSLKLQTFAGSTVIQTSLDTGTVGYVITNGQILELGPDVLGRDTVRVFAGGGAFYYTLGLW